MRARFSAYSLHLGRYIVATTHPQSPHFESDPIRWEIQLQQFSTQTAFAGLKLLEEHEGPVQAVVSFRATLSQDGRDISFSERSLFVHDEGGWLYHSAVPEAS